MLLCYSSSRKEHWLLNANAGSVSSGIIPEDDCDTPSQHLLGIVSRVTNAVVPHCLESSMRLRKLGEVWVLVVEWMPGRDGLQQCAGEKKG